MDAWASPQEMFYCFRFNKEHPKHFRRQHTRAFAHVEFHRRGWYCPLLKRMQLTRTAWVESLNTRDDGEVKHIK
jgi:hypothetical protein